MRIKINLMILVLAFISLNGMAVTSQNESLRPELRGHYEQGGIVFGQTHPDARVYLAGVEVLVSATGNFVFGFSRDEQGPLTLMVEQVGRGQWQQELTIQSRSFDIQHVNGLPPQTVTPDPKVVAQIQENNAEIWQARQFRSQRNDFASEFIWPAKGRISGVYGSQRVLNGHPRTPHYGLDIAAATGSPVYAPASGVVRLAHPDMVLSGGTLILDHGLGFFSTFLHLHALHVQVGDEVQQGDKIAEIGATGRATGPHLDWRINWGDVRLDPQYLVPQPQ